MEGVDSWLQIKIRDFGAINVEIISKNAHYIKGQNASLFTGMLVDKHVNMKLPYCKHLPDSLCAITKYLLLYCQCIYCLETEPKF